jgi:hypothetical protein
MKTSIKLSITVIMLLMSMKNYSSIYYVKNNATGTSTGLSWTNAFTTINQAFAVAIVGDQIWVSIGVYKPSGTGTSTTYNIPNGVEIYGGFLGNETSLSQRDLTVNITTLNGDIGTVGTQTDNCKNVVTFLNVSNLTIFDGFKIINGYNSTYTTYGAAIYNNGGQPTIRNCEFIANYSGYGGAVGCTGSSSNTMTLINCKIRSNTSFKGGGIYINSGIVKVINSDISNNTASSTGGAIESENGTIIIDRTKISGNTATDYGGAIDLNNSNALVEVYNSLIVGNIANEKAVLNLAPLSNQRIHRIVNCTISGNRNIGISTSTSTLINLSSANGSQLYNSIIWNNTAYRQVLNGNVYNCIINGNVLADNTLNISTTNPSFVNIGDPSSSPFTFDNYNYQFSNGSTALDYGNNSYINSLYNFDLNNTNRIQNTTVDAGCYEGTYLSNLDFNNFTNQFKIYPNPMMDYINIETEKSIDRLDIYSINGVLVKTELNTKLISVKECTRGIYVLRIYSEGNSFTLNVIKQ